MSDILKLDVKIYQKEFDLLKNLQLKKILYLDLLEIHEDYPLTTVQRSAVGRKLIEWHRILKAEYESELFTILDIPNTDSYECIYRSKLI